MLNAQPQVPASSARRPNVNGAQGFLKTRQLAQVHLYILSNKICSDLYFPVQTFTCLFYPDCASLTKVDYCSTCLDSNSTGTAECTYCQGEYHLKDDKTECVGWYFHDICHYYIYVRYR